MNNPPVDLDFSHKYDREHAEAYLKKHQDGLARKLSHRRDVQLARHALKLAGQPNLVLDLPCGAGRFWPLLAEKDNRVIIGADNSADMLAVACAGQPDGVVKRVRPLQTSASPSTCRTARWTISSACGCSTTSARRMIDASCSASFTGSRGTA